MNHDHFDLTTKPYWRVDETPRQVDRRMLILPGVGYTCDRSLLAWTAAIAHQHGWWVQRAWWSVGPDTNRDDIVNAGLRQLAADAPQAETTVVVAKSMGSRAAAQAAHHQWPGIWLTPLLTDQTVRQALLDYGPPALLVGGTKDHYWMPPDDQPRVRISRDGGLSGDYRFGQDSSDQSTWVEVADALHPLEVDGDWKASIAEQQTVFGLIEEFLISLG